MHGQLCRASRVVLAAVLLASSAVGAAPKGADARAQFDKGVAAYTKGDYAAASQALGASFVLEPDPETLFAWAQTERKLGHCDRAVELYTKLLKMDLPAENKEAVKVQIGECKAIIAEQKKADKQKAADAKTNAKATDAKPNPKTTDAKTKATDPKPVETKAESSRQPETPPPPPVEAPPPVQQPIAQPQPHEEPKPEGRTWWKDPVGGALVGAGAIGIGLGIVFLVQGNAADSDKTQAMTYPDYESLANRAESRGRLGVISLVAGSALAAGGVVWYVTRKPSAEKTVTTLVVPGGSGIALSGRF